MLLIEGWLKLATGEFDKVADQAQAMVKATNEEEGCLHYSFSRDIADPDLIRISERWASQEALAAHSASAHMAAFNKAIGGAQIQDVSVNAWTAEHWRTLMGR